MTILKRRNGSLETAAIIVAVGILILRVAKAYAIIKKANRKG
ncbi:hypothetical protein [Xylocopilactobacillus apicola]|nr:hypothetical protein [Xylocopilactobacillus apicola]